MVPEEAPKNQFEYRMRLRRAATCISAARAALEEGHVVEAQERLEEACRLDPEGLEARLLLEELQTAASEELASDATSIDEDGEVRGARRWSHWVALFIAVVALAALAWLGQPTGDGTRARPGRGPERTVAQPDEPASVEAFPSPTSPSLREMETAAAAALGVPTATTGVRSGRPGGDAPFLSAAPSPGEAGGIMASAPKVEEAALPYLPTERKPADIQQAPAVAQETSAAPSAPAGLEQRQALPIVEASRLPAPTPPPPMAQAPRETLVDLPVKVEPEPAPAPDAARASLPDPAADEEAVGETLRRYAEAYERLDATAAKKVWPSVDERALARAFAGLSSQNLHLERCDLTVDGAEATAVCKGRARYVPRVGDRDPITQSREWTFRLRRAQAGWHIERAEAK